jgi:hypothetical protein
MLGYTLCAIKYRLDYIYSKEPFYELNTLKCFVGYFMFFSFTCANIMRS